MSKRYLRLMYPELYATNKLEYAWSFLKEEERKVALLYAGMSPQLYKEYFEYIVSLVPQNRFGDLLSAVWELKNVGSYIYLTVNSSPPKKVPLVRYGLAGFLLIGYHGKTFLHLRDALRDDYEIKGLDKLTIFRITGTHFDPVEAKCVILENKWVSHLPGSIKEEVVRRKLGEDVLIEIEFELSRTRSSGVRQ